jgi:Recombinase
LIVPRERQMKNRPSLLAVQNAFLKRLFWKRYRSKIPENEQTKIALDQFCLRIKIDSRNRGFDPEQAMDIAKSYIAKRAPWYDVEAFQWKSRDKIKLLDAQALGEAITLTEREWWQCKPARGAAGIVPIDKGKDKQVREWIREAQRKSAEKRSDKLKVKRKAFRESLETEVRQLLKEGLSYRDIAEKFEAEHRKQPPRSGIIIHIAWTERQVFGFDPDRKENKRKYEAERKRMKRNSIAAILQDLKKQKDAFEETRRLIYTLHFEGSGYAAIARILNERKRPSRKGGKWVKSMVKRELERVLQGYSKCPVSTSDYTRRHQMDSERGSKLSQAGAAVTQQQEDNIREESITKDQSLLRLEWSNPTLTEMIYTGPLRQLYCEKVPEAS